MRLLRGSWYALCAMLCVCAHPIEEPSNNLRMAASEIHDLETMASTSILTDISTDNTKVTKNDLVQLESVLIPLKSTTKPKNRFAIMALPLEPDAEMLPAHYTGVKSPGVDHMELRQADPETLETKSNNKHLAKSYTSPVKSDSKVEGSSTQHVSSSGVTKSGGSKARAFENSSKGSSGSGKQATDYSESRGKSKKHFDEANESGHHQDHAEAGGGSSHGNHDRHHHDKNSKGYHNVYHKDERKKSADFYKNGNEGGKFKKHDYYNERHTSAEGEYKKGSSNDSGFNEGSAGKQGMFEKAHVEQEAEGRDMRQGYDRHFKNFQGFGKQGNSAKGRSFGFANTKAH